jgi:hypothetical protein
MKLKLADYMKDFDEEKVVTNPKPLKNHVFTEDGLFSEKIFGNPQNTREMTKGWIYFGDNYIINPTLYNFLKKVFPSKLNRMLKAERNIDLEGNLVVGNNLDNIGMIEFRKNFNLYVEKYGVIDCPEYRFIKANKDLLFINKIPVMNTKIRPAMVLNDTIIRDSVNDTYGLIVQYAEELKISNIEIEEDYQINNLLYNLQDYCNQIIKIIYVNFIRRKKGWFRNNIMSTRIDYSARLIITPLVKHRIDEIAIPYRVYLELYKKQLINLISRMRGVSYFKASKYVRKCTLHFDKKMYKFMLELNKKTVGGQYILLNRNPSLAIGSILLLKIKIIKDDYYDMSLGISNNILNSLAGDYDGDVLNIIPLFVQEWVEAFKCHSPERLIISLNDGTFNKDFFLEKEQKIAIDALNNNY